MIILDTNVLSEMMRPVPNIQVVRWLEMEPLISLATTSISIAEIRLRNCERQGQSMEAFDCMIAAITLSHDAVLATRNVSDFEFCNVRILNPWDE